MGLMSMTVASDDYLNEETSLYVKGGLVVRFTFGGNFRKWLISREVGGISSLASSR